MTTTDIRPSQIEQLQKGHNALCETVDRLGEDVDRAAQTAVGASVDIMTHSDEIRDLWAAVRALDARLDVHIKILTELEEKVAVLARPSVGRPVDDTNDRIIAYLRDVQQGQWINPSSTAVNLGLSAKSVASRLDRLARVPGTGVECRGGRGSGTAALYRVLPPSAEE